MARPRRRSALLLASTPLWAATGLGGVQRRPVTQPALAVRSVTVVDVRTGERRRGQTVLVEGERIQAVGPDIEIPAAARVVDGTGLFMIPGLWDMHVHLAALEPQPDAPEQLVAHGVTGVRDMGGYLEPLGRLRAEIDSGARIGPRLLAAGNILNGDAPSSFHRVVTTRAEAHRAVQEMQAWGARVIKVHNQTAPQVFHWLADEARAAGLPLVGHVPRGVGMAEASAAGMASIEHVEAMLEAELYRRDDPAQGLAAGLDRLTGPGSADLWAVLARNGTAVTPTLSAYRAFVAAQDDPEARRQAQRLYARLREIVPAARDAGVLILAGTDDRSHQAGASFHRELADLVEAGLTPLEALRAATWNAAAFFGLEAGAVEPGRLADLVLLGADPLEDIGNVGDVAAVILRGRLLTSDELDGAGDRRPEAGRAPQPPSDVGSHGAGNATRTRTQLPTAGLG